MTSIAPLQQEKVSLPRRLGAILYDLFLLIAVLFSASFLPVILFNVKPGDSYFFLFQAYIFLISYLFYAWFWVHHSQTLGMRTWKVKVVTEAGSNLNWKDSFVRYAVAILSALALGLGFLWMLWDKQNRTWYDMASKTKLIRASS